jgi:chromosome segregation ATPase
MDEFDSLEEPPPFYRSVPHEETRRKSGVFAGLRRPASKPSGGREPGAIVRTGSRSGNLLALVAIAVVSAQGWLIHDLRTDLGEVRTRLEEAHSSLSLVWESTKRLDEDRMGRLGKLADSIRSVFDYTQRELQLWEASYATLGQRVNENDNALKKMTGAIRAANTGFARADQSQRSRLEALERQQTSSVEARSRLTNSQKASTQDVNSTVRSLRETLRKLDNDLGSLTNRLASSTSQYSQLGRRVESLSGWADGFRRAGLSADVVQEQFQDLADEVRRLRTRMDSQASRAVMSSDSRWSQSGRR